MHDDLLTAFGSRDPLAEAILNLHLGTAEMSSADDFAAALADAASVTVLDYRP